MRRHLRWCGFLAVMGAAALSSGCSFTGGGWLISLIGGGEVTIALHGTFDLNTGVSTGSGELHDHSPTANVDAHLDGGPFDLSGDQVFDWVNLVNDCTDEFHVQGTPNNNSSLFGTYTPQPTKLGPGGKFAAVVFDLDGSGNPSPGDFVVVKFYDGVYDGYFDCGYLGGGNFQVKP